MEKIYKEILEEVKKIPVIDTHEHLPPTEGHRDKEKDILKEYLSHYMSSDLISSGLKREKLNQAIDSNIPITKRWDILEPYWEVCRYTGYGRALDRSVKGIYGVDGINRKTIEKLNQDFKAKNTEGHFEHVLKDLCGIELSILDAWMGRFECDKNLFRRVWQPQNYIIMMPPEGADVIQWLEETYDIKVRSIDDFMEAFRMELEDNLNNGIIALKSVIAYFRPLYFEKVDYNVAKKAFESDFKKWEKSGGRGKRNIVLSKEVQDFMMHYILSVANEKNLTFQFHTGLLEGSGGILSNTNPELMANLFNEYPNVNFDLFHISYPYYQIATALCKNFPNVYIDMCWAHIISPTESVQALGNFLDVVPFNKICGFGGDYIFVDGIYGHLEIARENISKALAQKVKEGVFTVGKAINIAQHLLYDNPKKIFKLEDILMS